jgi:hypothetical protein
VGNPPVRCKNGVQKKGAFADPHVGLAERLGELGTFLRAGEARVWVEIQRFCRTYTPHAAAMFQPTCATRQHLSNAVGHTL